MTEEITDKNELDDTGLSSRYQTRTQRIINRDGSFNIIKTGISRIESFNLYHYLVETSWPKFFLLSLLFYFLVNTVFSVLYVLIGVENLGASASGGLLHNFTEAFFFSAQTLTTVGYGRLNPQSHASNIIAIIEAGTGWLIFALMTGLLYGRFSRPTTNIIYSKNAILSPWKEGLAAFQFRLANAYNTKMLDAEIQVIASWLEDSPQGEKRVFFNLKPEYSKIVFFPTAWTVNHIIDEHSPMYGKTKTFFLAKEAEFLILFKAHDDTFGQVVNSRFSYRADEIAEGVRFARVITTNEDGIGVVALENLSKLEKTD
jgi:inward rectifier potassium channel